MCVTMPILTPQQRKLDYEPRTELANMTLSSEMVSKLVVKSTRPIEPSALAMHSYISYSCNSCWQSCWISCWLPQKLTQRCLNNAAPPNNLLAFAMLNVQSIKNKSSIICDLITNSALDVLVLTQTWHDCISDVPFRQAATTGYYIVNMRKPRQISNVGVNHGGIAVLHRDSFSSRPVMAPFQPPSFELLVCHFSSAVSKSL